MKKSIVHGTVEFREIQLIRKPWVWLLLISPTLLMIGVFVYLAGQGGREGEGIGKDEIIAMALGVVVNLVTVILVLIAKFEIVVTDEALHYRWTPFMRKYSLLFPAEIENYTVRNSPKLHLGYKRVTFGYGRVHNTGTEKGLQFVLRSGKKIFISAQKIGGFQRAIGKLIPVSLK